jgi:hypothetical protein
MVNILVHFSKNTSSFGTNTDFSKDLDYYVQVKKSNPPIHRSICLKLIKSNQIDSIYKLKTSSIITIHKSSNVVFEKHCSQR